MKSLIIFILSFALGFASCYFFFAFKKEKSQITLTEQLEKLPLDSVRLIQEASLDILTIEQTGKNDSLDQVAALKDSCYIALGKIETLMIDQVNKPAVYDQLALTRSDLLILVRNCNKAIMERALGMFQSSNSSLRDLVKDINDKSKQLQQLAKDVATISDLVGFIVKILALPILPPAAAAAATTPGT